MRLQILYKKGNKVNIFYILGQYGYEFSVRLINAGLKGILESPGHVVNKLFVIIACYVHIFEDAVSNLLNKRLFHVEFR